MFNGNNKHYSKPVTLIIATLLCFAQLFTQIGTLQAATSDDGSHREQARRIHDRLAGVPPTETVLNQMATDISNGDIAAAANRAMNNRNFYNVTLKNFITPWTNEAQTVFAELNDYTATVIGVIRDELDYRSILFDDILYTGAASGLTAYSVSNNAHYREMEIRGLDLSDPNVLKKTTQSAVTGLPAEATAGIVTTRAAARAFFIDGTNRAMFRFTLLNHLCVDMEQIKDNTRATDRIRQDASRSPGGDSRIYINACSGCHAGMDPMMQAYAYYDFEYTGSPDVGDQLVGQLVYNVGNDPETGSRVQPKFLINATVFPDGYVTPDDRWDNYWREGPNSVLGWDPALPGSGAGAKSMGQELAYSEAFASCQAKKVFRTVCLREPDGTQISNLTSNFKNSGYNLKTVFADAVSYCMGK